MGRKKECERGRSLPQALDELVHAIKTKALLGGVADIHGHMLRVEFVPEVTAARQTSESNNPVVGLAQPCNFPPAQVVDGRERV